MGLLALFLVASLTSIAQAAIMPDCIGSNQSEAQALITAAGLVVGSISSVYADSDPGTVIAQDPVAGSSVEVGQVVSLTVVAASRGQGLFDVAFWGIMKAFLIGTYFGLFIKLTNRS